MTQDSTWFFNTLTIQIPKVTANSCTTTTKDVGIIQTFIQVTKVKQLFYFSHVIQL
jgi:hypothetical protein